MDRVGSWASGVRRTYERGATSFESGVQLLERRYTPLGRFTPGPFERTGRFLWQPAVLGFVALTSILAGSSFTNSPFKFNQTSTWFFGNRRPTPGECRARPVHPVGRLGLRRSVAADAGVAAALGSLEASRGSAAQETLVDLCHVAAPMVVAPPLFSRDVFSAAQGEMTWWCPCAPSFSTYASHSA